MIFLSIAKMAFSTILAIGIMQPQPVKAEIMPLQEMIESIPKKLPKEVATTTQEIVTEAKCIQCVEYIRSKTKYCPPKVKTAKDIPILKFQPIVGSLALFDYKPFGHVAYVEKVNQDSIEISEANYKKCQITYRTVKLDDPHLLGYFWTGFYVD